MDWGVGGTGVPGARRAHHGTLAVMSTQASHGRMGARPWSACCLRDSLPTCLPAHQPMLRDQQSKMPRTTSLQPACHSTQAPCKGAPDSCAAWVGAPQCGPHHAHLGSHQTTYSEGRLHHLSSAAISGCIHIHRPCGLRRAAPCGMAASWGSCAP